MIWKLYGQLLRTLSLTLPRVYLVTQKENNQIGLTRVIQEIKDLAKKRAAHNAWLNDKSSQKKHDQFRWLRSQAKSKIRKIKDAWWADKAVELQGYADQHAAKLGFFGLTAVYGPTSKSMTPIRAEDGTLLTDKEHILER